MNTSFILILEVTNPQKYLFHAPKCIAFQFKKIVWSFIIISQIFYEQPNAHQWDWENKGQRGFIAQNLFRPEPAHNSDFNRVY